MSFKELFKYYKSRNPPPDVAALDRDPGPCHPIAQDSDDLELFSTLGLELPHSWKSFSVHDCPGLLFIRNPFTWRGQRFWIEKCLADYTRDMPSNLRQTQMLRNDENWFQICSTDSNRKNDLLRKLRWVTLGYHHNWDTKQYSESFKSDFPPDLAALCQCIVQQALNVMFTPQAAILNYYYPGSTISGHRDESEVDKSAPLVSLSFGHDAVFLIGGLTADDPATAVLLRSGDVVIMSGESRSSIHGVPLVRPSNLFPWNPSEPVEWSSLFSEFISSARINVNVRQVLPPDQRSL